MKEIAITFSPDELKELAKQLNLARYFSVCSGEYDNCAMADEIMNRVCAAGMAHAPETNAFREGGPGEPIFFISHDMDDECEPYIELYNDYVIEDYLPYALADRDFMELHGTIDADTILGDTVAHRPNYPGLFNDKRLEKRGLQFSLN